MGRRKIEIKAIKDDRNRSVTFLKRKGGLFKKAHELSVLCSVDVAVIIFGSNKKLYEYSSSDMRELVHRYTYHNGPSEHKGPNDFNGGNYDEEDDDDNGTPPLDGHMEPQMMPPHFQGQGSFPPHVRQPTPSASPPISNGVPFQSHPGHHIQRSHTPQPQVISRPTSRNDVRRISGVNPSINQPAGPQPVNGFAFMPQPAIYQPPNQSTAHMGGRVMHQPSQYPPFPPQPQPQQHLHGNQVAPTHAYVDEQHQRASLPPPFPPPGAPQPTSVSQPEQSPHIPPPGPTPQPAASRDSPPRPPPPPLLTPAEPNHHIAPPPPRAAIGPASEPTAEKPQLPLLKTSMKKAPQRKGHSIFTPIDENRSILSQHFSSFVPEVKPTKSELALSASVTGRAQSVDVGSVSRGKSNTPPPPPLRASTQQTLPHPRNMSISSEPAAFTPPSRAGSLKSGGGPPSAGVRPRLKVRIPDGGSEAGTPNADVSVSPRTAAENTSQPTAKPGNMVLPPPSPSATALLSAGATGPPNPFARPPPLPNNGNGINNNGMSIDTPPSALPSRFLNSEFLPSPSSFYHDWNFRANDSNTLPSPLNFATPVVGTGPSFLRDENPSLLGIGKRKSPDLGGASHGEPHEMVNEVKRVKVE